MTYEVRTRQVEDILYIESRASVGVGAWSTVVQGNNSEAILYFTASQGLSTSPYEIRTRIVDDIFYVESRSSPGSGTWGTAAQGNNSEAVLNFVSPSWSTSVATSNQSVQVQTFNLSGNTAGNTSVTGSQIILQGGDNITLSGTGNTIIFSAAAGSGGAQSLTLGGNSAGQSTVTGNGLIFAGGNNITLSGAAGAITISAANQTVQTQGAVSLLGSTGNVSFQNSNGITFGGNASTITASHNGLTTQTNQVITAFATGNTTQSTSGTFNASSMMFVGTGAVSVGISNGSVVVSGATAAAGGAFFTLTGNTTGDSTVTGNSIYFQGGNNITLSGTSDTIVISGPTQSQQTQNIIQALIAGTQTATNGTVSFVNSNGITFGMSESSHITASYTVPSIAGLISAINISGGTTSNNLSALTFSDGSGVSFGLNGSVLTATVKTDYLTTQSAQAFSASGGSSAFQTLNFANSNGLTFSNSAGSVIASYTVPSLAGLISAINVSAGTTSNNLSAITLSDLNGMSFGLNGSVITGSHNGLTQQSTQPGIQTIVFGDTTFTTGAVSFSNANGFSFGSSGAEVTASYTVPTVTNSSWTVSDAATSGTVGRLAFTNLNGITLSLSSGTGGLHTIVGSHNALTSQSNHQITAGNGGFTFETLSFSNVNGISFGTSAGSAITGSYTVPNITGLISAINFSAGTTSNNLSAITFSDLNGLSFGLDGSVVTGSHNALTSQSNQAISAGNGSFTFQTATLADSNGVSFSTGAQGLFATVRTNYASSDHSHGNPTLNLTNLSGTTASNSAGFTLSLSAAAAGGGTTISYLEPRPSVQTRAAVAGRLYLQPLFIPAVLEINRIQMLHALSAATNHTGNVTQNIGIYSLNGSTWSSMNVTSRTWAFHSTLAASSASAASGTKLWSWAADWTIQPGMYLVGVAWSTAGNGTYRFAGDRSDIAIDGYEYGTTAISTLTNLRGIYTAATNAMPGTIAITQISRIGTAANFQPWIHFLKT